MTYEDLQLQTRLELSCQLTVLRQDVAEWTDRQRLTSMGLSPTQSQALRDLTDVVQQRRQDAFIKVDKPLKAAEFADGKAALVLEMTGAQELWRVFRTILSQHEEPGIREPLQAADTIARDCYAFCIRQARKWNAITPDRFREQPMVFLDAAESAATAGREDHVQLLSAAVRQWRDVKLPLPFVLLPADHAHSIWTFPSLHHEVGHNLDQDLDLVQELRGGLIDFVPPDREIHWRRWSAEILADVFGVLLGGAGFATFLASLAFMLGPGKRFTTIDEDAVHPPFLLRVRLLVEMLKLTAVPGLMQWANDLQGIWDGADKPEWLLSFAPDAPAVAKHFFGSKLEALKGHALIEMNPHMARDYELTDKLANFFATGLVRPAPDAEGMHPRLIPCAAKLAAMRLTSPDSERLAKLQKDALIYLGLIEPDDRLSVAFTETSKRKGYLEQLARNLDYRQLGRQSQREVK